MHVDTLGRIYTSVVSDRPEGQMFRVGYQRFGADGTVQDTIRTPRPDFQSLTATYPERKLYLETGRPARGGHELTRPAIELTAFSSAQTQFPVPALDGGTILLMRM